MHRYSWDDAIRVGREVEAALEHMVGLFKLNPVRPIA